MDSVHYPLGLKGNKNDTYNDIIQRLIDESNKEFTDEEAKIFNERIEKFEKGDYSETIKLDIDKELKKIGKTMTYSIYEHKEATLFRKKDDKDKDLLKRILVKYNEIKENLHDSIFKQLKSFKCPKSLIDTHLILFGF